jgi:N-acetylglucosaminyl-diphospho-decaprenol L-rhamnosyltransferase
VPSALSSPLSIDVAILAYGRWDLTARCLDLLAQQTVAHSMIVIDNGSTDGTADNVRASYPQVTLVELKTNVGLPLACNRGVAAGSGDVIVLLNNDIEPQADFVEKLVQPLRDDPSVGSAASLLVQPGGLVIDSVGLTADRTLAGFPRLSGKPVRDAASADPVLTGPCGGGGAYRRTAWNEVGGLDEGVRFYNEDLDLALRLRAAGWGAAAVPEAVAVHLGSATLGKRSAPQRRQSGFSRAYFVRRYRLLSGRSAVRVLATEAIVVAGDAVLSRDLSAGRGRLAGWRAARGVPARTMPPAAALDGGIGFAASLKLRREVRGSG